MSKISTYEVVPVPKLADKLIGTSVGGEIEDATYNFTLQELLELFLPVIPANNLQGVLDYGNTATQDINLFGTITTTNLEVTDTANLFITYLNEETHIVGGVYDSEDSIGTSGQVLTSTGEGVAWVTLPPIFTPNLQQVLTEGNTSTIGIVLDATLEALDVDTDTATINTNITIDGTITDELSEVGTPGQVLSSTSTGVEWVSLPVYSAVSPLLFNNVTGVFSIQQASNVQGGFLSSSDWITFDGKQPAGNYITALTGEASASGPGAASTILSNSAIISKVLTGFNPISGTINPTDSILTAFGKTQSQINALVGGVQYKGTWNASTNTPTLQSSVGVQGNYYIVNVAGTTNLNGITDWQVGDWAIFSESTWQKVDNTESVVSVNGFTGAVSLTTDNIPEGSTNLYYLNSRARSALSFAAGSGAYDNVTGVITIPTNNNQILNGAGYITLASLSASAPLSYNNLTGGFAIQKSDATHDGYLSSTDWSTFNNKQNYLGGTGLVKSTAGTITYITDNSGNWNTAYDRSIVSAAVTGTTTKTLTLTEQDGNTIQASWTDLDTGLTSVGVSMPSAFSVANSPLTANGTIAVTGAGTTLQYIDGTGALRTFPGLTGYVPYTGATQNVDLGTYGLLSDYLQLNISPSAVPTTVGTMSWNNSDGTMDIKLKGGNVTLQVGEENVTRVVNKSGIDLLEANYQVVRARKVAEGGAQGQRIAVVLAQGNSENSSTEVLGLVTETILANQEGFITYFGEVKEIDTTGSLQGETWVDGDILYLSNTVAGALTNVRPVAPNHSVIVGYVTYAHAVHGKIYMAIDTGYELGELHNVYAPSPTANQSIYWNVANSRYQLNTIGGILGYTPADAATTLTINGTTYDLSADRTWSVGTVTDVAALTLGTTGTDLSSTVTNGTTTPVITLNVPTASAANRGALSAADWSTFNTKVGGVTATSPLFSSGGSTPNITIQQASGSQNGYLSSTDWTTFNNKQAAGNYITSLTGEATASGPGAAAVTLNNASVTAKVLTGINITGGTVQATDTMLTAFGKLQNQINGLVGGSIYQGTWNASTNTPALASGVGTKGYYYIVSVAGTTNLDGITDWFVGDWAIFDGTAWQQVDNTDAVVSVNGQTGAVSLTTDNIPEGATNQYYLDSRARAALSFTAGSGAYNSTTGVITIPTNTSQLTNGANFITLASLSGTAPIQYNNTTGAISITQSGTASNGYLSSTDWNTFNNKQAAGNYVTIENAQNITGFKTFTALATNNEAVGIKFTTGVVSTEGYLTLNAKVSGTTNSLVLAPDSTTNRAEFSFSNTALRTYTLPNANGTLALTSDIPSVVGVYLPLAGGTLTGPLNSNSQISTSYKTTYSAIFIDSGGAYNTNPVLFFNNSYPNDNTKYFAQFSGNWAGSNTWGIGVRGANDNTIYISSASSGVLDPTNTAIVLRIGNHTAVTSGNISSYAITGTGTAPKVARFSGTGTIVDSYITDALGTATLIQKDGLTITAPILRVMPNTSTNAGLLQLDNAGSGTFFIGRQNSAGNSDLLGSLGAYASVIGHTGTQTLHLVTNALSRLAIDGSGNAAFTGRVNSNSYFLSSRLGFLFPSYLGNRTWEFASDPNLGDGAYIYANSAGYVQSFFAGGNVGIGTTTDAGYKLDVNGTSKFSGVYSTANYHTVAGEGYWASGNGSFAVGWYNNGGSFRVRTNTTEQLIISTTGEASFANNITASGVIVSNRTKSGTGVESLDNLYLRLLGSNAIGDSLNIKFANAGGTQIANIAAILGADNVAYGSLSFQTRNYFTDSMVEMMRITNRYNVLINTSSGVTGGGTLQVNGNVNINGVFQINGVTIGGGGGSGVTGSGTSGYMTKWTGSSTLGNSIIQDNGSSITVIGGVEAIARFWAAGDGTIIIGGNAAQGTSSGEQYITYQNGTTNTNAWMVGMDDGEDWRFAYGAVGEITDANSLVRLTQGGNFIIGSVTDNGFKLQVNGAIKTNRLGYNFPSFTGSANWEFASDAAVNNGAYIYGSGIGYVLSFFGTGNVGIGTTSDSGYKVTLNGSISYAYGFLNNFKGSSGAGDVLVGNQGSNFYIGGNTNVAGSVTATGGFFDTSDSRLKTLLEDNYTLRSIADVKARLYIKDGRTEVGYYAQDIQNLMNFAINTDDKGYLSLSYAQVHTAKIAVIEDEVTILKNRVSELEFKLQKYEA